MTHSKAKIQGVFYPLQNDEWLRACRELIPARKIVFHPEHGKGIHLWGRKGEIASTTAVTTCLELNIAVKFQEVEL